MKFKDRVKQTIGFKNEDLIDAKKQSIKNKKAEIKALKIAKEALKIAKGQEALNKLSDKFISSIIGAAVEKEINGEQYKISDLITNINKVDNNAQLNEEQNGRLNKLYNLFNEGQSQTQFFCESQIDLSDNQKDTSQDINDLKGKLEEAIRSEVTKEVGMLKESSAWKSLESVLNYEIEKQTPSFSQLNTPLSKTKQHAQQDAAGLKAIKSCISLHRVGDVFEFKANDKSSNLTKTQQNILEDIAEKSNTRLANTPNCKDLMDQVKQSVNKIKTSEKVIGIWEKILNFLGLGKTVDKVNVQQHSKASQIRKIVDSHNKEQTNAAKATQSKLSKDTSQQL